MNTTISCAKKTSIKFFGFCFVGLLFVFNAPAVADDHGLAMFGKPLYPKGFSSFHYVEPNAPKGGTLKFSILGSFDSLNPLAPIGLSAFGVREFVYESLMARALDEPFTLYGLLAQRVEVDKERKWITFYLHPKAAFSDGTPVRVEDIIFTATTLRELGRPNHRFYYRSITKMEKIGARGVRFELQADSDWEMPLLIGLMPILSQAHWQKHAFGKARRVAPVGSGPYTVGEVQFGKKITFVRNKNYWGWGLGVNRGRFNFDVLEIGYWRDDNSRFQALKRGQIDFLEEDKPTRWAKSYNFPAVRTGKIVKKNFSLKTPAPMWALALNTRRDLFASKSTRQALALTFDRAWINKNLFFGLWKNNYSFWARSLLASRTCCEATAPVQMPLRVRKRQALALLQKDGWRIKNNQLSKNGKPFTFTLVVKSRLNERIALVWAQQLKQFGIQAKVRFVDDSQFERRRQNYDYDVIFARWYLSLSPGKEQRYYWGSEAATTPASRNYAGIRSRAVDRQIDALTHARTHKNLAGAVKKLDQLLLDGHFVIPLFYADKQWVALDSAIGTPANESFYGYRIDTWWRK